MNSENFTMESQTDWAKIDVMTDENIDLSDAPELTDEMWEKGVWRKGEILENGQQTLKIDSDIIEYFKKQEGDYRENINRLLRSYVEAHQMEKV